MKTKRFTIEYPEKVWVLNKCTQKVTLMEVGGIEVNFEDGEELVVLSPLVSERQYYGYIGYRRDECYSTKKELLTSLGASIEDFS